MTRYNVPLVRETTECINFYIKHSTTAISVASLDVLLDTDFLPHSDSKWLWFSRINVHKNHRKQGWGSLLMEEVCRFTHSMGYNIYCVVNPYGEMSFKQTVEFYKQFGFVEFGGGSELIYMSNPAASVRCVNCRREFIHVLPEDYYQRGDEIGNCHVNGDTIKCGYGSEFDNEEFPIIVRTLNGFVCDDCLRKIT